MLEQGVLSNISYSKSLYGMSGQVSIYYLIIFIYH